MAAKTRGAKPPGVYSLTHREYHADPCDPPSLSSSIAHLLCAQSPRHAWTHHPRLNPDWEREDAEKFDIGTAAHRILLEGDESGLVVVDASDWRTRAAADERDLARERGLIPLLTKQLAGVRAMVDAAREQLAEHEATPPLFTDGTPEQTIVWEEPGGVMCRAMLDWLRNDHCAVDDLKTTSRSAHPEAYSRALFDVGGDVQAAFYLRGILALTGALPEWRWVVVETSPPYALSVVSPGPAILELGHRKVEHAIRVWRDCLTRDEWPAYPTRVCYAEMPAYEEARWLDREAEEEGRVAA